jgi:hypothetical protein
MALYPRTLCRLLAILALIGLGGCSASGPGLHWRPPIQRSARKSDSLACFAPHLVGRLVLSQPDVNRVTQKVVSRPGQVR